MRLASKAIDELPQISPLNGKALSAAATKATGTTHTAATYATEAAVHIPAAEGLAHPVLNGRRSLVTDGGSNIGQDGLVQSLSVLFFQAVVVVDGDYRTGRGRQHIVIPR